MTFFWALQTSGAGHHHKKRFQFDLDADFPSLGSATPASLSTAASKPIPIGPSGRATPTTRKKSRCNGKRIDSWAVGAEVACFASADHSSLENGVAAADAAAAGAGVKRRRRKFPSQRAAAALHLVSPRVSLGQRGSSGFPT